jgi:aspartate racemase
VREMKEQVIGILGGMGPEATLDCFAKIIKNTPAEKDQDHLRVLIDSNPKVPDRTAAIIGAEESPVPLLVQGAQALERAGANFLIMPCVSAHFFEEELRHQIKLPFISIFDAVTETIQRDHPRIKTVGLMGTTGTIRGGLFQKRLSARGIETIVCDEGQQTRVMEAIYDIKNAQPGRSRDAIKADLTAAAESLINGSAQGIIAGCTEIPLVLTQEHLPVPYFDAPLLLARAAIRRAGRQPIPLR